jgi:hypothetical protein
VADRPCSRRSPALCGLNRSALYDVLWTGRASEDLYTVLTPLIVKYEAGKLRPTGPRSNEPTQWQLVSPGCRSSAQMGGGSPQYHRVASALASAMGPNQSLRAGSTEPVSHNYPSPTGVR